MSLCGRTMHGSGSCHASPESLTFAFWGEIVPSLPDLNYRVTQGMFQAFMAWGVHFISVSDCYLKKRRKQWMLSQSNAFGVILIIVIALLKQFQKCLKWSLIWTARKTVQNLGNEAKETNIVKCLTCFSDCAINSCYTLAPLFCVRFKSVLNLGFHAKSVTALKGKKAFPR